jgi:hypothetical protein
MKNKLDYIKEMGIDSRFTCPILSDSSQCPKNIPDRQLIHGEQVTSCNPLLVVSKTEEKEPMRPADDCEDGCNILLKGVYF